MPNLEHLPYKKGSEMKVMSTTVDGREDEEALTMMVMVGGKKSSARADQL